jgi:lincosamide nucleotidyltransferase A/C/D/E
MSQSRDSFPRRAARRTYRMLGRSPAAGVLRLPVVMWMRDRANATHMTAGQALEIVDRLRDGGVQSWLAGGWGVDALVGHQTREHSDLDLIIALSDEETALQTIGEDGYAVYDRWADGLLDRTFHVVNTRLHRSIEMSMVQLESDDWRERVDELARSEGFEVPEMFTSGVIDGQRVPCVTIAMQLALHVGYKLHNEDLVDVALLCDRFSLEPPRSYRSGAGELSRPGS